ncbi:unnamed protein product [Arctogadus glacialis]
MVMCSQRADHQQVQLREEGQCCELVIQTVVLLTGPGSSFRECDDPEKTQAMNRLSIYVTPVASILDVPSSSSPGIDPGVPVS